MSAAPRWTGSQLEDRCRGLGALLRDHSALWRSRAAGGAAPAWHDAYPSLAAVIAKLEEPDLDRLEHDPHDPDAPEVWRALAADVSALTQLAPPPPLPPISRLPRRIRARKWSQVRAFCTAVPPLHNGASRLVDWCSGVGHLGRTLAQDTGLPLTLLELDADLCATGRTHLSDTHIEHSVIQADALTADAASALIPGSLAVGLHSCGLLGERLLQLAPQRDLHAVALAPCCHYRRAGHPHAPLSTPGAAGRLPPLDTQLLRQCTAAEMDPTAGRAAHRRVVMTWRRAVDLLIQRVDPSQSNIVFPMVPRHWYRQDFDDFARAVSARFALPLPKTWHTDAVLAQAAAQRKIDRARSLPRTLFRRALELWLITDQACALQEAGWHAELVRFCAPEHSPRDLMVRGWRA